MSANEDIIKQTGSFKSSKDDRGGATLIPSAVKGIVKNNIDDSRTGKIQVYLIRQGSNPDENNPKGWTTVNYMSPFFGYTPNTGGKSDNGTYVTNPNSYGMWMTPPDIGTEVICVFLNGDPSKGYYLGALPIAGINHMVPALGSSDSVITNSGEAKSYGGATRLPVSEINNANPAQGDNTVLPIQPRPVHSYQAGILFNQGLIRDPDRGTIGSSSMRESPSHVFGISTPGRPIYQGGYTDATIGDAIKDSSISDDKFKIIGRLGGHSIVMDDGDVTGNDQLIRLRTAQGHTIIMNDAAQTLFIMHANGKSYIELGKEGTIDMYATNSVNIRTQGDLNLHADRNINLHAGKDGNGDINMHAENIRTESNKETSQFVGTTFKGYTKGEYTQKNESKTSILSGGEYGVKSNNSVVVLDGTNVKLNSGDPSLTPQEVKQLPINAHPDTLRDDTKGWAPAPGLLPSITSRAPAHSPWANANFGVDIKVDNSSSAALPASPNATTAAVNTATSTPPANITSPAIAATTPTVAPVSKAIDNATTKAVLSQVAVSAATGPLKDAVTAGAGVVTDNGVSCAVLGAYGSQPGHLEDAGFLKAGASIIANKNIQSGMDIASAIPTNLFTGKDGIKSAQDFVTSPAAQANVMTSLMAKTQSALTADGTISGNESGTQIAGIVTGGAIAGISAVKNLTSTIASGAGLSIPGIPSVSDISASVTGALPSDIKGLVSGAGFASGLADKAMSAFSGVTLGSFDPTAALKGFTSGMFSNVLKDFEDLTSGSPLNLTKLKEAKDAAKSALDSVAGSTGSASTLSNLTGSLGSAIPSIPGLNALGAGVASVTNIVSKVSSLDPSSIPGVGDIANVADKIKGAASSGLSGISNQVDALKSKISTTGLEAFAKSGISSSAAQELESSVSSLGGGSVSVAIATVATDTSPASAGVTKQLSAVLGDDRIPPIAEGPSAPAATSTAIASVNDIATQIATEEANYQKLKDALLTAQDNYGLDSAQATAADAAFTASAKKLDDLNSQLNNITV